MCSEGKIDLTISCIEFLPNNIVLYSFDGHELLIHLPVDLLNKRLARKLRYSDEVAIFFHPLYVCPQ